MLRGSMTQYFRRVRWEEKRIENAQLFILRFPNPSLMVLTLLRISEFKECSVHAGTIFSNTRYRTWFRSGHNGYDYDDFVVGMNLPDANFTNFFEAFVQARGRNRINRFERTFLAVLEERGLIQLQGNRASVRQKFYVVVLNEFLIGNAAEDEEGQLAIEYATLRHELSHAAYYLSTEYREAVQKAWDGLDPQTRNNVMLFLAEKHYTRDVIVDEFGAYLMEPYDSHFPVDKEQYAEAVHRMTQLYSECVANLLPEAGRIPYDAK